MNLALSDEQSIFRDSVLKFSQQHLREGALERAHSQGYPADIARLMARNGLMGLTIPAEAGGMGGTLMDAIIAIETVASICPRSADVIQSGNFGAIRVLAEYGTPAQRERFLSKLLNGDAVISVGMTEPDAGSAVTELRTTATPEGNGYRINGSKIFTTHGPFADIILAYVRFGPGIDGIGSVLIERGTPGFNVGNGSKFMSGEEWATLVFDDVYVPEENVVLKNGGFKKQIAGFNVERLGNSAFRMVGVSVQDWHTVQRLADIVASKAHRSESADLTLYKGMGTGIADLAMGAALLERATACGNRYRQS